MMDVATIHDGLWWRHTSWCHCPAHPHSSLTKTSRPLPLRARRPRKWKMWHSRATRIVRILTDTYQPIGQNQVVTRPIPRAASTPTVPCETLLSPLPPKDNIWYALVDGKLCIDCEIAVGDCNNFWSIKPQSASGCPPPRRPWKYN